jgi:hypothetical protein
LRKQSHFARNAQKSAFLSNLAAEFPMTAATEGICTWQFSR